MYGLEKKSHEKFAFDLEKEIKEKPTRGKQILEKAEKRILEIKSNSEKASMRKNSTNSEFCFTATRRCKKY